MKQIKVNLFELIKAPIDDKNIMSDWVMDNLFDDQTYVMDKNEALGFVGGYPTYAKYGEAMLCVRFLKENPSPTERIIWASTIVEHLTENDYETIDVESLPLPVHRTYICEDTDVIEHFALRPNEAMVEFYFNEKK